MDAQGVSAPLTMEQMTETVSRLVQGFNASDPKELARELFSNDGDFTTALIEAAPKLATAAAEAAKAFAESLEGMPVEKSAEMVSRAYAQMNGRELGETVNAFSRLLIRLHEENPELFSGSRTGLMADVMETADFGKLRKALTYRYGERLELIKGEVELLGDNPVALVNVFSVVAPLVNDAVQVLKSVTEILALPAEAMTYALFKILEDIEWRELATVVNGAASIVVTLHRGSYILGDGSLYTRGPFGRIASELVSSLDGQVLAEALAGAGEEAELFLTALASQVLGDAGMAVPLVEAVAVLANAAFRTASAVLEKAASLPAETTGGIARALTDDLELAELARLLNNLAALGGRLHAENPGLARQLSQEVISNLEFELSPESAAAGVNLALSSYNGWARNNPDAVARGLGDFLAGLDQRELKQAAQATGAQVADALSRNPEVLKVIVKAVLSIAYGSVKGFVKSRLGGSKARGG